MQLIRVPDTAYESQEVVLGSKTYTLLFKYNSQDKAWYISILDTSRNPLISGIKVMPNQNLTKPYEYLNVLKGGHIWCRRSKLTGEPLGRDNFGVGLSYELLWISSEEAIQRGLEDVIQLS